MREVQKLFGIALSFGLTACAIHPLPENVTGVKTTQIVHRIRCEARDAVLEAVASTPQRQSALSQIGIVYAFSLSGTETDSFMPSATFISPLATGSWSVNASAGDTVSRQNVRTFTIVDNYNTLLQMNAGLCAAQPKGVNYQYPVVGSIGIAEMVRTFIGMASHANLEPEQQGNITQFNGALDTNINGAPTMVDTISFMTTLSGGVTPTLTLTPVGSATQFTGANLGVSFMRQDAHQVIVGLALPGQIVRPVSASHLLTARVFTSANQPRSPLLISAASPRTATEQAALEAVNNQIIRYQLPRPFIVTQ
ncbi:hypothetical protein [Bradyrhizobium erythrophlei]|uniref:Lipoprotein n=1 Tax=Bradyrhizobium erythrophlei TaxID=1437360 RepID=A0A1M7TS92_9BRAD|nr:hypothetical protein [Bradyrhizobium erythrophlei]SHN73483.1 hypothetical protein SAMN05444170_2489 [Bradyrhizobium erythrophlei]